MEKRYYECSKCGEKVYCQEDSRMILCKCKTIAVDNCNSYKRVTGREKVNMLKSMKIINQKNVKVELYSKILNTEKVDN
jgi:hypothetical protein